MISRTIAALAALGLSACAAQVRAPEPAAPPKPIEVQIIGINDFHGNLETPGTPIKLRMADGTELNRRFGGAASLAATVQRLRTQSPNSITVSAGDLIGASPLVSAYFLDEPTIQAMNAIGLELDAVGNHEFDRGSAELLRMQKGGCEKNTTRAPCRLEPFGGASFSFLAANVRKNDGSTLFPESAVRNFGPVTVGFIGMTLKETQTLVTPAGVAGLTFADEAETANALVPQLKAAGADTIVLLIHQGGKIPDTYRQAGCEGFAGPILGIMDRLDPAIAVVVSGHTHHAYTCELQRSGASRLLTSAGRYGYLVTDIRLAFDPDTHKLAKKGAINVPVIPEGGADAGVASLVSRYAAAAAPAAARVVGRLRGDAPYGEDDEESPASNLIADAQVAATRDPKRGGADLAFINTGGVRVGLKPAPDGSVTYGQIFAMQPFGNNLVVKTFTGTQLKDVLEQQFAEDQGKAKVAALLAPSENFRFYYDLTKPAGQRIVAMELNRQKIDAAKRYRVTVNNFLASGGDGFSALTQGSDTFDAGLDLDALEAWLATNPASPAIGRTIDVNQPVVMAR